MRPLTLPPGETETKGDRFYPSPLAGEGGAVQTGYMGNRIDRGHG